MNTKSIKNKIRKRNQYQNQQYEYQDVGSLIKEKRKELKLTQETISNGICSISYLSKIENNQIMPNEYFVREIMTKLDVEESRYMKTIDDRKYLSNMIEGIFYYDQEVVSDIFNDLEGIEHNMTINICKLGYYAYFSLEDTNQYVMMLENLVQNMDDFELKTYLLFSILMAFSKNQSKRSLELIELAKTIQIRNDFLDALLHQLTFELSQELHIYNSSFYDYNEAMKINSKYNNYIRMSKLRVKYIEFLSFENPQKTIDEIKKLNQSLLSESEKDLIVLTKAKVIKDLGRYKESIITLNHIKESSIYHFEKLVILYELCILEKDVEMKLKLEKLIDGYKLGKHKIKYKIFYHYLKQNAEGDMKEYLRDVAIPFSMKMHDFNSFQFYTEKLMDICIESSRYKEATQHFKRYQKEKNKIRLIYQQ